jgi:hypothetical protein
MIYLPLLIGFTVFLVVFLIGVFADAKWCGMEGGVSALGLFFGAGLGIGVASIVDKDIQDGRLDGQAVEVRK